MKDLEKSQKNTFSIFFYFILFFHLSFVAEWNKCYSLSFPILGGFDQSSPVQPVSESRRVSTSTSVTNTFFDRIWTPNIIWFSEIIEYQISTTIQYWQHPNTKYQIMYENMWYYSDRYLVQIFQYLNTIRGAKRHEYRKPNTIWYWENPNTEYEYYYLVQLFE